MGKSQAKLIIHLNVALINNIGNIYSDNKGNINSDDYKGIWIIL